MLRQGLGGEEAAAQFWGGELAKAHRRRSVSGGDAATGAGGERRPGGGPVGGRGAESGRMQHGRRGVSGGDRGHTGRVSAVSALTKSSAPSRSVWVRGTSAQLPCEKVRMPVTFQIIPGSMRFRSVTGRRSFSTCSGWAKRGVGWRLEGRARAIHSGGTGERGGAPRAGRPRPGQRPRS